MLSSNAIWTSAPLRLQSMLDPLKELFKLLLLHMKVLDELAVPATHIIKLLK